MHCFRSGWLEQALRGCLVCCFCVCATLAQAQTGTEISRLNVERADDALWLSAQINFEIPPAVEDALVKGIPMYFVTEADILRERWYWYDKRVTGVERHIRVAYQPLTRKWRLNMNTGPSSAASQGLSLNQSYDSLAQALATVKRVSRWKIAEAGDIDPAINYRLDFRFKLDLSQLPRPFQIGALGQSDWDISALSSAPLAFDAAK
jgi:hypothetical protein